MRLWGIEVRISVILQFWRITRSICDPESRWLEQKRRSSEVSGPKKRQARDLQWLFSHEFEVILDLTSLGVERKTERRGVTERFNNHSLEVAVGSKEGTHCTSRCRSIYRGERLSEERPTGEA